MTDALGRHNMDEPTPREIMRRLDEVSRQMVDLGRQLVENQARNEALYVRKDVYAAEQVGLKADVAELQANEKTRDTRQADTRRQLLIGITLVAIPALFGLLLALSNFVANGGALP